MPPRSDLGPSSCRPYQTSPNQLGALAERYPLLDIAAIRGYVLGLAATKLRQYTVPVLPVIVLDRAGLPEYTTGSVAHHLNPHFAGYFVPLK